MFFFFFFWEFTVFFLRELCYLLGLVFLFIGIYDFLFIYRNYAFVVTNLYYYLFYLFFGWESYTVTFNNTLATFYLFIYFENNTPATFFFFLGENVTRLLLFFWEKEADLFYLTWNNYSALISYDSSFYSTKNFDVYVLGIYVLS